MVDYGSSYFGPEASGDAPQNELLLVYVIRQPEVLALGCPRRAGRREMTKVTVVSPNWGEGLRVGPMNGSGSSTIFALLAVLVSHLSQVAERLPWVRFVHSGSFLDTDLVINNGLH